jgi:peptide chain release factor 2
LLPLQEVAQGVADAADLLEMAVEEQDEGTQQEIAADLDGMLSQIEKLELQRMFSGKADGANAFMDIQKARPTAPMPSWIYSQVQAALRRRTGRRCCCECICAGLRATVLAVR